MDKINLTQLAKEVMKKRGLQPEFLKKTEKQLKNIESFFPTLFAQDLLDLRSFIFCSIDNEDSHDLDQLTYGEYDHDHFNIWVALSDVSSLVNKKTPIDDHAKVNATSVYTPTIVFPMLPQKISNDLGSLLENEERIAIVVYMKINPQGKIIEHSIMHAKVKNYAKLTYHEVGLFLEDKKESSQKIEKIPGLAATLQCQYETAKRLRQHRYQMGALSIEPSETRVKMIDGKIVIKYLVPNPAYEFIEHLMIAANHVIATYLKNSHAPCLCRIVKKPKRWDRIVEIAKQYGGKKLDPQNPNPKDLEDFLQLQKKQHPESFQKLSLVILKLLGKGEYVAEGWGIGHFGLALKEYTHFTAPNRRFADLVTQRLLKSILYQKEFSYSFEDLKTIALHCTEMEDAATKVERHLNKSAAALLLLDQIGKVFPAVVTGAAPKGTWVKIFDPHVEGKMVAGDFQNWDVGDQVKVKLISVDVEKGFINFSSEI